MSRVLPWLAGLGILIVLVALLLPAGHSAREATRHLSETRYQAEGKPSGYMASPAAMDRFAPNDALPGGGTATAPANADRKIIYSATVELAVEDFAGVPEKVVALVKQFDGYVAGSNLSGSSGESRRGTWKIRVPVARFEEFTHAAKGLGELISAGTSSRDVSEEYYDVDARIRNKTKEEERLLKLLEERPGKLEDVIAIERELSRVREELERMQGRMRVLADLTSLTTVDLTVTEIHNYKPEDAPTLTTRVRRTFDDSLSALATTSANFLVAVVALIPWLVVVGIIGGVIYAGVRTQRRRTRFPLPPQ